MPAHQCPRRIKHLGKDDALKEIVPPGLKLMPGMLAKRAKLKGQKGINIKNTRLVLLVELVISAPMPLRVNQPQPGKLIGPTDIAVNGQERVI